MDTGRRLEAPPTCGRGGGWPVVGRPWSAAGGARPTGTAAV